MHDHETVTAVAAEIITWQAAAQHLPLPDLRAILATWQDDLAESLDTLNGLYVEHGSHHECTDIIGNALGEVTRNATAAAIFTVGLTQRARQAAHQN